MIQIGGKNFHVPQPGGMRSFALTQRLVPVAGRVAGVIMQLVGIKMDVGDLMEKDVLAVLPRALPHIGEIFAQMQPGDLESIARTLLGDPKTGAPESATCDKVPLFGGQMDAFEGLMRGRTADTYRLLAHALEVWYPDFFALARGFRGSTAAPASPSEGSSTSPAPGPVSA